MPTNRELAEQLKQLREENDALKSQLADKRTDVADAQPELDGIIVTTGLKQRHYDWLVAAAAQESYRRNGNWTLANHLEYIIRNAMNTDPNKQTTGATGRAGDYNPTTGSWG